MAWSDAARAAALEARRAHAKIKGTAGNALTRRRLGTIKSERPKSPWGAYGPRTKLQAAWEKNPRNAIALDLRAVRKGFKPTLASSVRQLAAVAAISTYFRNAGKKR